MLNLIDILRQQPTTERERLLFERIDQLEDAGREFLAQMEKTSEALDGFDSDLDSFSEDVSVGLGGMDEFEQDDIDRLVDRIEEIRKNNETDFDQTGVLEEFEKILDDN